MWAVKKIITDAGIFFFLLCNKMTLIVLSEDLLYTFQYLKSYLFSLLFLKQVLNLSEKRYDLTKLNPKVMVLFHVIET